jgi:hypothetical protein
MKKIWTPSFVVIELISGLSLLFVAWVELSELRGRASSAPWPCGEAGETCKGSADCENRAARRDPRSVHSHDFSSVRWGFVSSRGSRDRSCGHGLVALSAGAVPVIFETHSDANHPIVIGWP